jgi:hypothetical protein
MPDFLEEVDMTHLLELLVQLEHHAVVDDGDDYCVQVFLESDSRSDNIVLRI